MRIINKNNVWIIHNLWTHGNCLIPTNLIKQHGIDPIEEDIKRVSRKKVVIEKRVLIDEVDKFNGEGRKSRKKDVMYIAHVLNDKGEWIL